MNTKQLERYNQIKDFLESEDFNGFTKKDLFIMQFIKKGWGQDIAALSNMAEALTNIALSGSRCSGPLILDTFQATFSNSAIF
jgi:hypothetical protein